MRPFEPRVCSLSGELVIMIFSPHGKPQLLAGQDGEPLVMDQAEAVATRKSLLSAFAKGIIS